MVGLRRRSERRICRNPNISVASCFIPKCVSAAGRKTDLLNFVIGSLSQVNNNINQIARVMNALKGSGAVVIGSVAQRQLNQVEAILKEWNTFEGRLRQSLKSK